MTQPNHKHCSRLVVPLVASPTVMCHRMIPLPYPSFLGRRGQIAALRPCVGHSSVRSPITPDAPGRTEVTKKLVTHRLLNGHSAGHLECL